MSFIRRNLNESNSKQSSFSFSSDWEEETSTEEEEKEFSQQQQNHRQQTNTQQNQDDGGRIDGTLVIFVLVFLIFCFIWFPSVIRRCSPRARERRRQQAAAFAALQAAEEAALQAVMEGAATGAINVDGSSGAVLPHGMTLEERREFVSNVLLSKKLDKLPSSIEKKTPPPQDANGSSQSEMKGRKEILLPSSAATNQKTLSNDDRPSLQISHTASTESDAHIPDTEACAICLTEYKEGDDICWSHNRRCPHSFHRECVMEWLIRHDECPCCRHNYLALDDGDDEELSQDPPPPAVPEVTSGARNDSLSDFSLPIAAVDDDE